MDQASDKLIDFETTDMLLETLEEDFFLVVDEFIKSGDILSSKIKHLVDQNPGDIDSLIAVTHTLKGASGNIGAMLLSRICEKLEIALHDNQTSHIPDQASRVEQIYHQTREEYLRVFKKAS